MPEAAGSAPAHRLFFALWPSAALADGLEQIATAAAGRFGGRPTRRETLHLTLAFLGDVAEPEVAAVVAAGRRVVASPFCLHIDRLGSWRHNRLLWAGCAPAAGLAALIEQLRGGLAAAGHPLAERQYTLTPHLTLVRKLPAATPADEVGQLPLAHLPEWPCTRFALVASQLSSLGPAYRTVAEFPLSGGR